MVLVGAEIAFSKRAKTLTGPSTPRLVVTRMTPFAPRAPYRAVAVASFITEKLAMSSGWRRARSVAESSMLSIRMSGVVFPSKVATPRMKKSVLSCPGSPLLEKATNPAMFPARAVVRSLEGTLSSFTSIDVMAPMTLSFFCLPKATATASSNSLFSSESSMLMTFWSVTLTS